MLACVCGLFAWQAHAAVYQWRDAQGHIHFSDAPHQGAVSHPLHPLNKVRNPAFHLQSNILRVPYQVQNGAMVVKVRVNHVLMDFIVDTGATLMVLTPAMARQAHVKVPRDAPRISVQTANGVVSAATVRLHTVQLAHWSQRDVPAAIQAMGEHMNVGLLGMSFLGAYRMSLDHQHQHIILEK